MTTTEALNVDHASAAFRALLLGQTTPVQFASKFGVRVVLSADEYDRDEAVQYFNYWLRRTIAPGAMTSRRAADIKFAKTQLSEMGIVVVREDAANA